MSDVYGWNPVPASKTDAYAKISSEKDLEKLGVDCSLSQFNLYYLTGLYFHFKRLQSLIPTEIFGSGKYNFTNCRVDGLGDSYYYERYLAVECLDSVLKPTRCYVFFLKLHEVDGEPKGLKIIISSKEIIIRWDCYYHTLGLTSTVGIEKFLRSIYTEQSSLLREVSDFLEIQKEIYAPIKSSSPEDYFKLIYHNTGVTLNLVLENMRKKGYSEKEIMDAIVRSLGDATWSD